MINQAARTQGRTGSLASMRILGTTTALLLMCLSGGAAPVGAQSPPDRPAGSPGRFLMQPADGGVLRLDSQTGSLSFCKKTADSWACDAVPDERRALEDENKRLKDQIAELKSAVVRLEELLGVGENPKAKGKLPTEQDIDRAADYIRGMLKKLQEKAREFEKDLGDPAPKKT